MSTIHRFRWSLVIDGIQAGPEIMLLGKNNPEKLCIATAAINQNGLIIRTESHLLRIK
jgi:hypothetical protein